ncbi:GNAT family N-acetyltransferase [Streptomyces sp. NPDC002825]|uniref:GNAT family N-acetyltransferase n=1 Tax=Streptomyces sp. NPDC002825 TaxID=3154666 RepID=UPI003328BA7B
MPDIVTRRRRPRRLRRSDAPALARYRSDPSVARYQTWRTPIDRAEAEAVVAGYLTDSPDGPGLFQYAVEHNQRPGLIGDLHVEAEAGLRLARVGITPAPDMRHRGYATERESVR